MSVRWGYVVVIAVLSLGAVIVAATTSEGSFTSPLLLQLGGGGLLFAGLYWIQRTLIEKRLEKVERKAEDLASDIQSVEEAVKETNVRLDTVGEATQASLHQERVADRAALSDFEADVTSQTMSNLLARANRLSALAPGGIRVQIPSSWHRFRFGGDLLGVKVTLESYEGARLKSWVWGKSRPVQNLMRDIAEELMRRNIYPGGQLDPAPILKGFKDAVELAMRTRWGETGPIEGLDPLIELPNPEWAITTAGLEAIGHTYTILATRFDESDWRQHMREKTIDYDRWEEAFSLAQALLKGPNNPFAQFRPSARL